LLYSERSTYRTFHDYISVTVLSIGDSDLDGIYDDEDCAPIDSATWSLPSESGPLMLARTIGSTDLLWTAPLATGGVGVTYDTIRSTTAQEFGMAHAICIEVGGSYTLTTDPEVPGPGDVMFYLVRPANGCGNGNTGSATTGTPRLVRDCL
jgi:hypothetical protein